MRLKDCQNVQYYKKSASKPNYHAFDKNPPALRMHATGIRKIHIFAAVNRNKTNMEFKEILAVSGQSGLFKFIAQAKNGIIVESLATGARTNISTSSKVSALGEIAIYTDNEEVPLGEVFEKIYEEYDGKEAISPKAAPEELKKFFAKVVPEYDRERVHVSDMKKVASWYNILAAAGMTEFKVEKEDTPAPEKETAEKGTPAE